METKLLTSLGKIAGIGGIALGVVLLVFQGVLKTKFLPDTGLTNSQAYGVIQISLVLTFGIAATGLIAWVMTRSLRKNDPLPPWLAVILAVLSLGILFAAIITARNPPIIEPVVSIETVTGAIGMPVNDEKVDSTFKAKGTTKNATKDTRLWLVVRKGTLTWPKAPVTVDESGDWVVPQVNEEGSPDEPFSLVLFVADREADQRMRTWLTESKIKRSYEAFPVPPDTNELWRVTGLRRKN